MAVQTSNGNLFCGGQDRPGNIHKNCYTYDFESKLWLPKGSLKDYRDAAGSTMFNETHWWVTGGGNNSTVAMNLPRRCVKCQLRALIEGQLSARARLAKTEKCHLWQNFTSFSPKNVFFILIWRV